jgi:ribosome-associated heat shock protein Hsp15
VGCTFLQVPHDCRLGNREQEHIELLVRGISETRRAATLARLLYEETPESMLARQTAAERRKYYVEPSQNIEGRPTKRDRRALERWRET